MSISWRTTNYLTKIDVFCVAKHERTTKGKTVEATFLHLWKPANKSTRMATRRMIGFSTAAFRGLSLKRRRGIDDQNALLPVHKVPSFPRFV